MHETQRMYAQMAHTMSVLNILYAGKCVFTRICMNLVSFALWTKQWSKYTSLRYYYFDKHNMETVTQPVSRNGPDIPTYAHILVVQTANKLRPTTTVVTFQPIRLLHWRWLITYSPNIILVGYPRTQALRGRKRAWVRDYLVGLRDDLFAWGMTKSYSPTSRCQSHPQVSVTMHSALVCNSQDFFPRKNPFKRTWVGIEPTTSHLQCDALPIELSIKPRWRGWCPCFTLSTLLLWNAPASRLFQVTCWGRNKT